MFNAMYSLQDNLATLHNEGKGVTVHLNSGQVLAGKIGGSSEGFLVLTEMVGKEMYDAVVRLQDVSAISARAR
jgi:sRNA-binding regulator protein Hfq